MEIIDVCKKDLDRAEMSLKNALKKPNVSKKEIQDIERKIFLRKKILEVIVEWSKEEKCFKCAN